VESLKKQVYEPPLRFCNGENMSLAALVRTALDSQHVLEEGSAVEIKELCKKLEEKTTDSWTFLVLFAAIDHK